MANRVSLTIERHGELVSLLELAASRESEAAAATRRAAIALSHLDRELKRAGIDPRGQYLHDIDRKHRRVHWVRRPVSDDPVDSSLSAAEEPVARPITLAAQRGA